MVQNVHILCKNSLIFEFFDTIFGWGWGSYNINPETSQHLLSLGKKFDRKKVRAVKKSNFFPVELFSRKQISIILFITPALFLIQERQTYHWKAHFE